MANTSARVPLYLWLHTGESEAASISFAVIRKASPIRRTLPSSTCSTRSCWAKAATVNLVPLNCMLDVLEMTRNCRTFDSSAMISSVNPSAK